MRAVAKLEGEIAALIARRPPSLGEPERQQLVALGADLSRLVAFPRQPPQRASVSFARHSRRSSSQGRRNHPCVLHWQGGDHTQLQIKQRLNAAGRHNPRIPATRSHSCVSWRG